MTHQHRDCLQLFRFFFFFFFFFLFWFLFSFPQPPEHFKVGIHGRVRNQTPPVWCGIVVILGGSWKAWVPSANLLGRKDFAFCESQRQPLLLDPGKDREGGRNLPGWLSPERH